MKNLLFGMIISLGLIQASFADSAKLRMKINGPIKDNRYFLCVTNIGCVSIQSGNKGKVFPMDLGNVNNIFTINATNMRINTQSLPGSCNVNLKANQTLTVKGTLIERPNRGVVVSHLKCSVT